MPVVCRGPKDFSETKSKRKKKKGKQGSEKEEKESSIDMAHLEMRLEKRIDYSIKEKGVCEMGGKQTGGALRGVRKSEGASIGRKEEYTRKKWCTS